MLDVIGVGLFCGLMLGVVASPLIIMARFSHHWTKPNEETEGWR